MNSIGVRALSDLVGEGGGGGGGDFLARKIYAIPECVIAEIGIQTRSQIPRSTKSFTISTSPKTVW